MSEGWREADYFDPEEATVCHEVAHEHAILFQEHNIKEYSQWFPGCHNHISYSLSLGQETYLKRLFQRQSSTECKYTCPLTLFAIEKFQGQANKQKPLVSELSGKAIENRYVLTNYKKTVLTS